VDINSAMSISRNHKNRTCDESTALFDYISLLVEEAKGEDDKIARDAMNQLLMLFKPKIFSLVKEHYPEVASICEFDDFMQDCYLQFVSLVHNYNPELSRFPNYIKTMMTYCIKSQVKSCRKNYKRFGNSVNIDDVEIAESDDSSSAMTQLLRTMYNKEYEEFIKNYANKRSKTNTLRTVCYRYFLSDEKCKDIAASLGIRYHAVYDCISKIKKELNYHLKHSDMFDFYFSTSGEIILKEDKMHGKRNA